MDAMDTFKSELEVNDKSKAYLLETAKWSRSLAIIGILSSIILIVFGFLSGPIYRKIISLSNIHGANIDSSSNSDSFISYSLICLGSICLLPCYYLLKFNIQVKLAVNFIDSNALALALSNQKSVFKFVSIALIIFSCFFVVLFVYAITLYTIILEGKIPN